MADDPEIGSMPEEDGSDDGAEARRKDHLEEREQLIDAARESARTFDKAVLGTCQEF